MQVQGAVPLFFALIIQSALSASVYAWPAFHVTKRWGQWGLFAFWLNASIIVAALYTAAQPRALYGVEELSAGGPPTSAFFWHGVAMAMLVLAGPSFVVRWRLMKGDVRFSPLTALRAGFAAMLGFAVYTTLAFLIYAP